VTQSQSPQLKYLNNIVEQDHRAIKRSNHVVTLAAKAITIRYYGNPMQHSYMTGCSKGGQAVLLEAQRFPNDYDGLIPVAPVYDFTGRAQFAAAWFAQAVDDGRGASVLNSAVVDAIHGSVLAKCGAQAGIEEGLVTNPLACTWMPEMMACAAGRSDSTCLTRDPNLDCGDVRVKAPGEEQSRDGRPIAPRDPLVTELAKSVPPAFYTARTVRPARRAAPSWRVSAETNREGA